MAISLKIRIADFIAKILAHTFCILAAFKQARAVSAGAL